MVAIIPVSVVTICTIALKGDAQPTDKTIIWFMILNSGASITYITEVALPFNGINIFKFTCG